MWWWCVALLFAECCFCQLTSLVALWSDEKSIPTQWKSEDTFAGLISQIASGVDSRICLLYLDDNVPTFEFLRLSGSYGSPNSDGHFKYQSFKNFLLSEDSSRVDVKSHLTAVTRIAAIDILSDTAKLLPGPITIITDQPTAFDAIKDKSTYSLNEFVPSKLTSGLVVVDLATLDTPSNFIVDFYNSLPSQKSAMYTSTIDDAPVNARRLAVEEPEDAPAPLRIEPFQLAALITLLLITLLVLMMVSCLHSIDVPTVFEEKALQINKEF
mmetsp:Transcript_1765/g.2079  ORF Transcript_1765/g.2079 Transcript_1765/m.2079 type:complete len:269 (+) Transcript_1765:25-831(+)